ncbi:3-deoxy-manno-octulosonate cytidylyltransferase [Salinisphaera sp. G21_0]|uniref:3-deoxy-manno-octulosonate cytidylyltransferase n=1 Tax=Salinisphaera sp. G21_0 TaxID=2821094 RepID=UPI001ADD3C01|nr:3-deoxy-manno-octulosonate cytidylyltransferase [Salinisphaera sp. G21_0]MBO9483091.1 3-deoxy-manno-octulosonate cytidylyltransferase [Salinisphaera sp. G21_0]
MTCKIVIPARYGSSRLPGKPLLDIAGKPMVQHVFERAVEAGFNPETEIVIATDHQDILDAGRRFGAVTVMTAIDHASGTVRLAEVAQLLNWPEQTIVVNLQGDEPLMQPAYIRAVADNLARASAGIATLATPITTAEDIFDPNVVKVVVNAEQLAMYFSRAPIPWGRDNYSGNTINQLTVENSNALRHLGLYAYRVETLQKLVTTQPPAMEQFEALEQLRALWLGIPIHVAMVSETPGHGVDTDADLERVRAQLSQATQPEY